MNNVNATWKRYKVRQIKRLFLRLQQTNDPEEFMVLCIAIRDKIARIGERTDTSRKITPYNTDGLNGRYMEWLEENLDKFPSEQDEIQFAKFVKSKPKTKSIEDVQRYFEEWKLEQNHSDSKTSISKTDGGPGSGNFGHEGVEGKLGGSAPSGSDAGGEPHKSISERTKPSVKSPKAFDDYVKEKGLSPIFRGYSAESEEQLAEYRDSYKNGTVPESGEQSSALGKGVYFSTSQSEAEGYMQRRQSEKGQTKGRVTTAALDVDAKIGNYSALNQKKSQDGNDMLQKAKAAKQAGDMAEYQRCRNAYYDIEEMSFEDYCRSQGYHAIMEPALGYVVVIDQKALVIRDDSSENIQ